MFPEPILEKLTILDSPTYRVLCYCHSWNVPVLFGIPVWRGSDSNTRGLFTIIDGQIWRDAEKLSQFCSPEEPLDLLHELSHVLDGSLPSKANELSGPMLALDYYGSRHLKLEGRTGWMSDFSLDEQPMRSDAFEWGGLCTADKHDFLQRSLKKAVRRGLLTTDGKPTFKRQQA